MKVEPFKLQVPDKDLSDLKSRIQNTRWPDDIAASDWHYGTSLSYLRELASYWLHEYDWRHHERLLNRLDHFVATVSGTRIHFIHVKSKNPNPIPLILTHGWPSSFLEMLKLAPYLTSHEGGDSSENFDLVIPSLPGFGFSEKSKTFGMDLFRIADLWVELMQGLGYSRFVSHGGDWGAYVSAALGKSHPEKLLGIHLSFIPGGINPSLSATSLSTEELKYLAVRSSWDRAEGGYEHLQRTKPQTIAYGLNDSPIGLAAWIIEKFQSWSDCKGDIESRFSKDELLTNIMIYWITQTAGSSARLYYETKRNTFGLKNEKISVPTSVAIFPKDLSNPPKEWADRMYHVVRWICAPKGGHFPAWEEPEFLSSEIRASISAFGAFEKGGRDAKSVG